MPAGTELVALRARLIGLEGLGQGNHLPKRRQADDHVDGARKERTRPEDQSDEIDARLKGLEKSSVQGTGVT